MSDQGVAGRRVLVVEDDYLLASDLAAMLRRAGAEVIGPFATVRDALRALNEAPDVATLDVQLREEASFPIADELARRGVPFVFATGTASEIPAAHAERVVCHKPVADKAILQALAAALIC